MINFKTLELAVYMAEEFRAGRYGFILYNPELKVFGIIGPFKKNEKYIFTPNAATYSFIKVDKNVSSYTVVTTATYNKFWDEEKERGLYLYLEQCTKNGIKWALSNVLSNNGIENRMLRGWIKEMQSKYNNIHLYYLESDYTHSNFRRKNRGRTVEVLLTNY